MLAPNGFRDASSVILVIEDVGAAGTRCGLRDQALEAAVRLAFAPAGPKVITSALGAGMYIVTVTTIAQGAEPFCAAHVSVAYKRVAWNNYESGRPFWAIAWSRDALITGPAVSFGKRAADTVEGYSKEFASAVLKARE
jgi:hypothetical protein